jgi:hypothetical protein
MTLPRMTVWRSPSGRIHRYRTCSGAGPVRKARKVRLTEKQFAGAAGADRVCRCIRSGFRADLEPGALDAYRDVAEELSGPSPLTLADLDAGTVTLAREYAKRTHQKWPPRPQTSGWTFQIFSL